MMPMSPIDDGHHEVSNSLPEGYHLKKHSIAPPAQSTRSYITPRGASTFLPGAKIEFDIPCGSPGQFLDPSQTVLAFTVRNTNNVNTDTLRLDGSAASVIGEILLYHGSTQISHISDYESLVKLFEDATTDLDSLRSSGTVRGVAEYAPTANDLAGLVAAYYSRAGATINGGGSLEVAIPLMCIIGTMAHRVLPLSAISDSLRLEIKLNPAVLWGGWNDADQSGLVSDVRLYLSHVILDGAVERAMMSSLGGQYEIPVTDVRSFSHTIEASSGAATYQFPLRVSSANKVFVVFRPRASASTSRAYWAIGRTRGTISSYRFRLGAQNIPASEVPCTGSAAEARAEFIRAMGSISDSAARSCVPTSQYISDAAGDYAQGGFAIGLDLQAFAAGDALADGRSLRHEYLTLDLRMANNNPALTMTAYILFDKLLTVHSGLLSYSD
ncbi:hypothetical protein KFE25_006460 [Diacronema lutheri]|uniref:Uncharacterized protein n=1 Tax=Diacronema lutheri TaxID=2081491 RepID=A0A8J5Y247_DIALT|nr:hypothetical protein KFE25_006454 [Diacronema lutheri]KAG8470005.1 hypothetical protein KFE25_006460 [Diacronema lutheri]